MPDAEIVETVCVIRANSLKLGAYRVQDPVSGDWSSIQFHLTYDGISGATICAVLPEMCAVAFVNFVTLTKGENVSVEPCQDISDDVIFTKFTHTNGLVMYQVKSGDAILALMPDEMAKMLCTMLTSVLQRQQIQQEAIVIECPAPRKKGPKKSKQRKANRR